MGGRIYNENAFEVLQEIMNETPDAIIVTDPPFNIGYHYATYNDRMDDSDYFRQLVAIINEWPSVIVHYPEALHRLTLESQSVPNRVMSWVYPSNTRKQHRDIAFYGVDPDFDQVRQPYKNPNDKRIRELMKRTGGGGLTIGWKSTKLKTFPKRRRSTHAKCRLKSCAVLSAHCQGAQPSLTHSRGAGQQLLLPSYGGWSGELLKSTNLIAPLSSEEWRR